MKICHWVKHNGSGMFAVAKTLHEAERKLGLDSHLVNVDEIPSDRWDQYGDSDIHVPHTHFPNEMRKRLTRPLKMIFPSHGTPELIVHTAIEGIKQGYGHGDPLQLWMYWMKTADAIVTFWPRHQMIMQSMADKNTRVYLAPLGLDLEFWGQAKSKGKFTGTPSVMLSENSWFMKWGYDMFVCWPFIYEQIPDAVLHATYVPTDQHRVWLPLINRNGAHYGMHISPIIWSHEELRHVLNSVDYYWSGVRYGDMNRINLEALASGAKVISYRGNPFSHYWVTEGSQVEMIKELVPILKGEVEPRVPDSIPTDTEMAQSFKEIYESVL